MARFTAVIAILQDEEKRTEQDQQTAWKRWISMREVIQDIANNADANGASWASERAKRTLAETDHWFE